MKKLLLLQFCLVLGSALSAQTNFGLKLATCLSGYEAKSNLEVHPDYKNLPGLQGGIFVSQQLSKTLAIQPELLLSLRGSKAELVDDVSVPGTSSIYTLSVAMQSKFLPLYLDLPLYLKTSISTGTKLMNMGFGPVFSYGLSGKVKIDASVEGVKMSGEQKLFEKDEFVWTSESGTSSTEVLYDDAPLKRFDFGLAAFGGWEFQSGILVDLGFQFGLTNISNDPDVKLFTRTLSFGIGYKL